MKIETLTEKTTEGKYSAVLDYANDTVSVDMGDGSDLIAIPFCSIEGLTEFLAIVKERIEQ